MRRRFLIAAILGILFFPVAAVSNDGPQGGPSAYLPEKVHEFSTVVEGIEVAHEFALINRRDAPLEILSVKSD
jgi:hypothetical protein